MAVIASAHLQTPISKICHVLRSGSGFLASRLHLAQMFINDSMNSPLLRSLTLAGAIKVFRHLGAFDFDARVVLVLI